MSDFTNNDIYILFSELSKLEVPLASNKYIEITKNSPELANKLADLLQHSHASTEQLIAQIYSPLFSIDDPESRIGRSIDGKYKIIELVGQGGMSDVYKAQRCDGLIYHTVAVKYFSLAGEYACALNMIKKEAQILAKLDHHFIASFINIGHDNNGEPNIMMEYIEGQTLFSYLKKNPSPEDLKRVYATLDEAKSYAESLGVFHGDISSNNVLVDARGNANIIDFDIAEYRIVNP